MATIKAFPFPKRSWVKVTHPNHPYYNQVGQIATGGRSACEVDFEVQTENGGKKFDRKPLLNSYLIKVDKPPSLEKGSAVVVTGEKCPYYQRRGVVEALIAGEEIALIDFGEKQRDEAGNLQKALKQIHRDDLQLLEQSIASSGNDKGGARFRSPQG